jgi:hypothetical protein
MARIKVCFVKWPGFWLLAGGGLLSPRSSEFNKEAQRGGASLQMAVNYL